MTSKTRRFDAEAAARNCARLPEQCYAFTACHAVGARIVLIKRGEIGFYPTTLDRPDMSAEQAKALVDAYNERLGVSWPVKQAMLFGSMFGFDGNGADPSRYPSREPGQGRATETVPASTTVLPPVQTVQ